VLNKKGKMASPQPLIMFIASDSFMTLWERHEVAGRRLDKHDDPQGSRSSRTLYRASRANRV